MLCGEPRVVDTPSQSGRGQQIARCPDCLVAVWSTYPGFGPAVRFIRVGTLDDPDALPPDVHIFTASMQPWVVLPPQARAFEAYYDQRQLWPTESQERLAAIAPLIAAHRARFHKSRD
jgi:hypothetical protein